MTVSRIESPCIKVCAVDGASGLCVGCGRSLPEIGGWMQLGDAGRSAVMAELPARLKTLQDKQQAEEKRA